MGVPRITIAGVSSGVGKTTITCSIIQGLVRRGMRVSAFKVGPDYIDPVYLGAAAGHDAHNLDEWVMGSGRRMLERFAYHVRGADAAVIEGVMGYYDGAEGDSSRLSTYSVADATRTPVILVMDASKTARTIAAVASGFATFQQKSRIAGVILNRLASWRHKEMCVSALREAGIRVLGCVYRDKSLQLDERHLGLYSTVEPDVLADCLRRIADVVIPQLEMDHILQAACSAGALPRPPIPHRPPPRSRLDIREDGVNLGLSTNSSAGRRGPIIGVALDNSFNFYYKDNLDALRREGARLVFFSPVSDDKLPRCDGLYIGGGFPEVLGARLERNSKMRKAVRRMAQDGAPVYAECGGLMYLSRAVVDDATGTSYRMAGVIDGVAAMTGRLTLNYTAGMLDSYSPITGTRNRMFKGHEFHYSEMRDVPNDTRFAMVSTTYQTDDADGPAFMVGIREGLDGILQDNTLAAYGHLYFDMANFAAHFVASCARYKRR